MPKYVWMSRKIKRRAHIVDSSGRTLCKTENNGPATAARLDASADELPADRALCGVCRMYQAQIDLNRERVAKVNRIRRPTESDHDRWARSPKFLQSERWAALRYETIRDRGARCECCGATPREGVSLVVDHIKPRSLYPELALEPSNLQVLCRACNRGKSNWDQTDWRGSLSAEDGGEPEAPLSSGALQ
jgi:5-methylcytosine-specific restriction endonuclease McrA